MSGMQCQQWSQEDDTMGLRPVAAQGPAETLQCELCGADPKDCLGQ